MTQQLMQRAQLSACWTSYQPTLYNYSFHFHQISLIHMEEDFLFSHYSQGWHRGGCLIELSGDFENCMQDISKQIITKDKDYSFPNQLKKLNILLPIYISYITLIQYLIMPLVDCSRNKMQDPGSKWQIFHHCITLPRPSYHKTCYKEGTEEIIWRLKMVGG